jgi:O-antigen/teichoic acid export membrane protein
MDTIDSPQTKQPGQIGTAVRSAMIWNMASMIATQIAQAWIFILMAGRLDPVVFGIFGLAAVFVDLFSGQGVNAFVDALVQRQDFRRKTLSTAFWSAMAIMSTVGIAFAAGSIWIASGMGEPDLAPVLGALSLTLLLSPLTVAPCAVARQALNFKGLAVRNIVASLSAALIALGVTFTPYAAWALVAQRYVQVIVSVVILNLDMKALPTFEFDRANARGYLTAAGRMFLAQGICGSVPRAIDLFVGAFFGVVVLGCLRVASKLIDILMAALINPIGQLFTILVSQAKDDPVRRSAIFVDLTAMIAALCLPGFLGVALTAHELTPLLFEPDYAPVADMLMILCGLAVFFPLTNSRNSLLTALNRLNLLVWLSVADIVLVLGAMWIARDHGWQWVLFASGVQNLTLYMLAPRVLFREMSTPPARYFRALLPPYLAASLMVIAVLLVSTLTQDLHPVLRLAIESGVGAIIYIGVLMFPFRRWTLSLIQSVRSGGAT